MKTAATKQNGGRTMKRKARTVATLATVAATLATPAMPPGISQAMLNILRPGAGAYRWLLPQLAAITPQYIEMTLRGALSGNHVQQWELFSLMEDTWPRLGKNLNKLKNAVNNMKLAIAPFAAGEADPGVSAKDKAALCQAAWNALRPRQGADENAQRGTVYDILDCWAKGYSLLEINWQYVTQPGGSFWAPQSTYWAHPVYYGFDRDNRLGLRTDVRGQISPAAIGTGSFQAPQDSFAPLPENKFLCAFRKHNSGSPMGSAMLRPLAWWWLASNFSADWMLNFAQLFGVPFRFAKYDPNAPQATVDAICNMMQNMGSAGWAAFPDPTSIEFLESKGNTDHSPQADILDRADKNCDLLVLGQTLTSDVGQGNKGGASGSRALGQVHQGVESEIVDGCGHLVAEVLSTQLFPAILRLNYGEDSECPTATFTTEKEEDLVQKATILAQLATAGAGAAIPLSYIADTFDIPKPENGEPTLQPKPQPGAGGGGDGEDEEEEEEETAAAAKQYAQLAGLLDIADPALRAKALTKFATDLEKPETGNQEPGTP